MKKLWIALVPMLALGSALRAENGDPGGTNPATAIKIANDIATAQSQDVSTTSIAEGGSSWNDNTSTSQVNINTTSNYEARTPPLTSLPPYLPYWTHGGWGTIKAYFPNSPTSNDMIYETTFDPENAEDMHELRSVLKALPYQGLAEAVGGVLNSVAVVVFGSPDKYHHGRGIEIVNSIPRDRRPEGKPLLVFIDSNVDVNLLREAGYAYMGKVSIEGDVDRNWDQAYKAAVAEALLWDTDILLVSGGMKGVTVGSNVTFPAAAAGYSQTNYSLSLMGAKATGITEGKGKAVLSADAYRFAPEMAERRKIPESLYDRIRVRPRPVQPQFGKVPMNGAPASTPAAPVTPSERADSVMGRREPARSVIPQPEPQGAAHDGQLLPRLEPPQDTQDNPVLPGMPLGPQSKGLPADADSGVAAPPIETCQEAPAVKPLSVCAVGPEITESVHQETSESRLSRTRVRNNPGIRVSRKLLAMAGYKDAEIINCVTER